MPAKPTWHPWIPADHFAPGGLADGLMAAWFALEGAGTLAHDLSRNGHHGSLQGNVSWVAGRDGPVLDFPGNSGDYVDSGNIFEFTDKLTIVSRMLFADTDTQYSICGQREPRLSGFYFRLRGDETDDPLHITFFGEFSVLSGATSINANTLVDVACAYNGSTVEFYVDGVLVGSEAATGSMGESTGPMYIAALNNDGTDALHLSGDMSNMLLYARALPAPDIRKLHTNPYALLRPVRRWWAVALDVAVPFVPQVYTADVLVNISPTVSVDANPSPSTDVESNPSPTVEVESG